MSRIFQIFGLEISILCFMRYWYNRKKQSKTKQKLFFTWHINIRFNEGRWSSGFFAEGTCWQNLSSVASVQVQLSFVNLCSTYTILVLILQVWETLLFRLPVAMATRRKVTLCTQGILQWRSKDRCHFFKQNFPAVLRMEPKASLTVGTTGRCSTTEWHLSPSNKTLLRSFDTLVNNLGWFHKCIFQTVMWRQG